MASRKRHFHISWMKMKTACLCVKMPPAPTAAACCSEPVTHIVAVWLHGVTEKNWMYCMAMLEPSRIQTSAKCRGRFVAFYARQQTRQTAFNRRSRSDRPRYASKPFTRDGLRRCRWPQPRHDVRLAELASLMAPHLHANARYKPVQIQHSALCLMPAWCRSRKTAFVKEFSSLRLRSSVFDRRGRAYRAKFFVISHWHTFTGPKRVFEKRE